MLGRYIGKDKNMGFITGNNYEISAEIKNKYIVLKTPSGGYCPYGSLEALLVNWELLKVSTK